MCPSTVTTSLIPLLLHGRAGGPGADHIFIGALIGWGSEHMRRLLRILAPFVDDGALSVVSHAGDGFDKVRAYLNPIQALSRPYLGPI